MGASLGLQSTPSQAEVDNNAELYRGVAQRRSTEALYPEEELEALRACFAALAVGGVIEVASFKPPMLPAEGAQWFKLYVLMCQLDEPTSSDGPLHWHGFLAGVTAYCKAFKSLRPKAMAAGYADSGTGLSDDALCLLLRHALVASRAGSDGDGAAPEWSFDTVLADVRRSHSGGSGTVSPEEWARWASLNLPALSACLEAFVLETLCAVGRQGGAGQGGAAASRAAPLRALQVFEPPLLEMAKGQSRTVLDDAAAWLLGMAIGPNQAADARAWRCLYDSETHGLSMNRFAHHAAGRAAG